MNFLLDTCVLSEALKLHPHAGVLTWLERCDEESLFLSVLTLGELEKGIAKLAEGKKKKALPSWVAQDLPDRFHGRILSVDEAVARRWGVLQAQAEKRGKPLPVIDSLIAATALVYQCTVATRNNPDMEATGVPLYNPWEAPALKS